jgi:hypothetical protein
MAATAQNLKRLVRFLATIPPAKEKLRNRIRVEISSAARTDRIGIAFAPPTLTFSTATK